MAGIYIHVPFCKQACYYCNFHFATSLKLKNDFIAALLKEIVFQKEYLQGEEIETIYFGGGTPSLLEVEALYSILEKLDAEFSINKNAEITVEANPDDIYPQKLKAWRSAGVNRLSIGVQSFFEEDLRWMNRAHDALQAVNCIRDAQQGGFDNMTIDLIYGMPGLDDERWGKNVAQAIALNIPHLSCYALTVEPKTPLNKMISRREVADVQPDDQARQFLLLMDWLKAGGYEHYEISNFARPGKRSRHNSSYWQGKKYLGLGPSAHSFDGLSRQWNVANNALYIQSIKSNTLQFDREILTPIQQLNEYIMTSLRTVEGCDLAKVENQFGAEARRSMIANSREYVSNGKIEDHPEKLALTNEGKLLADGIAAALFFI